MKKHIKETNLHLRASTTTDGQTLMENIARSMRRDPSNTSSTALKVGRSNSGGGNGEKHSLKKLANVSK